MPLGDLTLAGSAKQKRLPIYFPWPSLFCKHVWKLQGFSCFDSHYLIFKKNEKKEGNRLNAERELLQSKFGFTDLFLNLVSFNSNTKYMGTICNVAVYFAKSEEHNKFNHSASLVDYSWIPNAKGSREPYYPRPRGPAKTSWRPRLFNDNQKEAKKQRQQKNRKEERNLKTVSLS